MSSFDLVVRNARLADTHSGHGQVVKTTRDGPLPGTDRDIGHDLPAGTERHPAAIDQQQSAPVGA